METDINKFKRLLGDYAPAIEAYLNKQEVNYLESGVELTNESINQIISRHSIYSAILDILLDMAKGLQVDGDSTDWPIQEVNLVTSFVHQFNNTSPIVIRFLEVHLDNPKKQT